MKALRPLNLLIVIALIMAALVTPARAPHYFTAYDFAFDMVGQCVEDQECGTDTECMDAESFCIRELIGKNYTKVVNSSTHYHSARPSKAGFFMPEIRTSYVRVSAPRKT